MYAVGELTLIGHHKTSLANDSVRIAAAVVQDVEAQAEVTNLEVKQNLQ